MVECSFQRVVHAVGMRVAKQESHLHSDLDLLRRFQTKSDPLALELLIRRHGPLVHGVCRRFFFDPASAEDAFQATFLILVSKADSLRLRTTLVGWLHRVALRVCLKMRRQSIRSVRRERISARNEALPAHDAAQVELRHILDEEVAKLPAAYRDAFLLCHSEGRSCDEAAGELGCAEGTVHSRLARARARLRVRLLRRGIVPTVVFTAVTTAGNVEAAVIHRAAQIAMQFLQGNAAPQAVAALTQGVLTSMFMSKLQYVVIGMVAIVAAGSGAALVGRTSVHAAPQQKVEQKPSNVEELLHENRRLRDEVAALRAQIRSEKKEEKPAGNATPIWSIPEETPTEQEVLKKIAWDQNATNHFVQVTRDDIRIVYEKIVDKIHEPRFYPIFGVGRLHSVHWKCTAYCTETITIPYPFPVVVKKRRINIVYIDKDSLIISAPFRKDKNK